MSNKINIDDSLFTNNDNDIFASDGVFLDSKDIFNTKDKNVEIHPIKKETLPKIEENTPEIKTIEKTTSNINSDKESDSSFFDKDFDSFIDTKKEDIFTNDNSSLNVFLNNNEEEKNSDKEDFIDLIKEDNNNSLNDIIEDSKDIFKEEEPKTDSFVENDFVDLVKEDSNKINIINEIMDEVKEDKQDVNKVSFNKDDVIQSLVKEINDKYPHSSEFDDTTFDELREKTEEFSQEFFDELNERLEETKEDNNIKEKIVSSFPKIDRFGSVIPNH